MHPSLVTRVVIFGALTLAVACTLFALAVTA